MNFKFLEDLPKVTRTLLLINVALFGLSWILPNLNNTLPNLNKIFALYYFESSLFQPHQLLTHIFMHGSLMHLAFNMYALVMFGAIIEQQLGEKRFTLLYFFSAIGAFLLQLGITWYELSDVPLQIVNEIQSNGAQIIAEGKNYADDYLGDLNLQFNIPMVGASGAIMGLLISYAIMYPNAELQLIFLPVPIKAKFFIPLYMLSELFLGVKNFEWDNIAHFAHLGGAIFGGILMFYWKSKRRAY